MREAMLAFLIGLALGILLCPVLGNPAHSHEAPSGWAYDFSCCGNEDCRQARPGEVEFVPEGWLVKATNEIIPLGDDHIHQSKDRFFHICITTHHIDFAPEPHVVCIYVPPAAF